MSFLGSRGVEARKGIGILTGCSVDSLDLLGHEPDAPVWYRLVRHVGSSVLVAYDACQ